MLLLGHLAMVAAGRMAWACMRGQTIGHKILSRKSLSRQGKQPGWSLRAKMVLCRDHGRFEASGTVTLPFGSAPVAWQCR
jgi:hypothetical protein